MRRSSSISPSSSQSSFLLSSRMLYSSFQHDSCYRSPLLRSQFQEFLDRKSTRLNSSHVRISYAVFCLKKKKHTTFKNTFYLYTLMDSIVIYDKSLLSCLW